MAIIMLYQIRGGNLDSESGARDPAFFTDFRGLFLSLLGQICVKYAIYQISEIERYIMRQTRFVKITEKYAFRPVLRVY